MNENQDAANEEAAFDAGSGALHVRIPVARLRAHPQNYRRHPQDQIDHLVKSLSEHGFYRPVVVSEDMTILAGHGIVMAAKQMDIEEVPAVIVRIPHDHPKALKILTGDNELMRLAEIDDRALTEILKEIKDTDELLGTGFDANMLASLVMVTRPQSEINDINEAAEWVGMPEYEMQELPRKVIISFRNADDRLEFCRLVGIDKTPESEGSWSFWWPPRQDEDLRNTRFSE